MRRYDASVELYANASATTSLEIPTLPITMPTAMMFTERDDLTVGLHLRTQLARHVGVDADELESLQQAALDLDAQLGYALRHTDDVQIPLRAASDNSVTLEFPLKSVVVSGIAVGSSSSVVSNGNASATASVTGAARVGTGAGSGVRDVVDVMDDDALADFVSASVTTVAAQVQSVSVPPVQAQGLGGSKCKVSNDGNALAHTVHRSCSLNLIVSSLISISMAKQLILIPCGICMLLVSICLMRQRRRCWRAVLASMLCSCVMVILAMIMSRKCRFIIREFTHFITVRGM